MLIQTRQVKTTAYTPVGVMHLKAEVSVKPRKKVDHQAHVTAYCRWLRRNFT